MHRSLLVRLAALLAATSLVVTACGRDDSADTGGGTETTQDAGGGEGEGEGEAAAFINPDEDCDAYEGTTGVEGDTIKIGTVRPAAGPYAIYDKVTSGLDAFVQATNAKGGVKAGDGKTYKLELIKEDDAYDPAQTPAKVQKLVEQDGVFAIVGQIGTANNLAVRQYVNDNCVPSIALATGSTEWGKADEFPWFIGGLPSYATEAVAFLDWLKLDKPEAKIALLYQDDDFGKAYQSAIARYIEGTDMTVVAEQAYNPLTETTPESKVADLAGSGADVFFVGIGGAPCPAALRSMPTTWTPLTYVSITCASKTAMSLAQGKDEGVYSTQATMDPSNPEDQADARVQAFITEAGAAGMSPADVEGGVTTAGWNFGAIFVKGLEMSETVDRASVMNALYALDGENFGLLRPDVKVTTNGAEDPWLIEDLRVIKREGGQWAKVAEVSSYDGKSNDLAG